jgi:hypothetical protein
VAQLPWRPVLAETGLVPIQNPGSGR